LHAIFGVLLWPRG